MKILSRCGECVHNGVCGDKHEVDKAMHSLQIVIGNMQNFNPTTRFQPKEVAWIGCENFEVNSKGWE